MPLSRASLTFFFFHSCTRHALPERNELLAAERRIALLDSSDSMGMVLERLLTSKYQFQLESTSQLEGHLEMKGKDCSVLWGFAKNDHVALKRIALNSRTRFPSVCCWNKNCVLVCAPLKNEHVVK